MVRQRTTTKLVHNSHAIIYRLDGDAGDIFEKKVVSKGWWGTQGVVNDKSGPVECIMLVND